ncbi:type II secretion system F family protein [Roseateles sp.]|uniref:type II secretion system F family protein n=1 Tax=Roseateles sp. TaxID=1971397 RepID=UPI00286B61A4|nr:type II secretion system F family protein [Roseateles sp.]
MPQFLVSYLDSARRPAQAQVAAVDAQAVAAALGVAPAALISVNPLGGGESQLNQARSGQRFPLRQFAQQLSVLLKAGIPLLEALVTLKQKEEQGGSNSTAALDGVIARIQLGEAFSTALRSQPQAFDALFIAVVESSERSGQMAHALAEQADYLAWAEQLRSKLVAAAIYPATLIAAGTAVVMFLLVFVVPRFAGLLDGVGGDLPWASRMLIAVGQFCGEHPWVVLGLGCALLAGPVWAWQRGLRQAVMSRLWRLPLLGPKLHLLALAQFYRSLAMLLMAGVPVVPALQTARGVIAGHLQAQLDRCIAAVSTGERLSQTLEREGLSTPVSLRMLRVGERSGEMGSMLAQAAAFYDEELTRLSDLVTRLINPVLMLLMGLVIGTVVVLMYLPIFQLVEQVN